MEGLSIAAVMSKYSRISAGSQIIRVAAGLFATPVEFVLLEPSRAMVVASVSAAVQPRPILPAEQALLAGSDLERTATSTAARVRIPQDFDACLSIAEGLDPEGKEQLTRLAKELSEVLLTSQEPAAKAPSFESSVLRGLRDAVVVLDSELAIAWCNNGVVTMLGWSPSELVGKSFGDFIAEDDFERTAEAAAGLVGGQRVDRLNISVRSAHGDNVAVSITGFDHSADPLIGGLVLSIRNDEREIESERALDTSRRVSDTILKNLHEAVIATDDVGAITIVNDAARQLFAIPADTPAINLSIADISLLDTKKRPLASEAHPLGAQPLWVDEEVCVATADGMRHVSVNRSEVPLGEDRVGIVVTFDDMTQARTHAHELQTRALHDQLTGLANRRHVNERLRFLRDSNPHVRLGACFVGIDQFKDVNDIHGHRVGDAVLRATAKRLSAQVDDGDVLARLGGDEFLVVLVDPQDRQSAFETAERIRAAFDRPFDVEGNQLHLTASVGIAFDEFDSVDDERLLQRADIALYAAKARGRDCIEVFSENLAIIVARAQAQRNMVRDALDGNGVEMHFQPIVDNDGRAVGVEALARCRDQAGEVVLPSGFMNAIDGTNLMVRLDETAFEQSCRLAATFARHPSTAHMWVASNFSAASLGRADFADNILHTIADTGVAASALCIELTETAAFKPGKVTIDALTRLHDEGLRIALDDFGTGYSSLSHLRDLPLTTVKIDRSFTSELHRRGAERAIATAVCDIAASLGFSVVAEGVETEADKEAVQAIGIQSMQGWLFSHAVPAQVLLEHLKADLGLDTIPPSVG